MKAWRFLLPPDRSAFPFCRLDRAQVVRADGTSFACATQDFDGDCATVSQPCFESATLQVPCVIDGLGEILVNASPLMERTDPYRLTVELARGEVSRAKNLHAELELQRIPHAPEDASRLRDAVSNLGRAIRARDATEAEAYARKALADAVTTAEAFTLAQAEHALAQMSYPTSKTLGCSLGGTVPAAKHETLFRSAFDFAVVPLSWAAIEREQGSYDWDLVDGQVAWCGERDLAVTMGPVLEFRASSIPPWLSQWQGDLNTLVTLMTDWLETCYARYGHVVRRWIATARMNSHALFGFRDAQLMWLTKRMMEAGQSLAPQATQTFELDRPWGDAQGNPGAMRSPIAFLDTMIRAQTCCTTVNIEIAFGYGDGGSFARSLLDLSRLLDHYRQLGAGLEVTLSFPSTGEVPTAGGWHGKPSAETQAAWAEAAVKIAWSKPSLDRVIWRQWQDDAYAPWPGSGLVDAAGHPKPALDQLVQLRERYRS